MTEWNQNSDDVRDVKGYEGLYKVNIYGDVYSIRSNREMTKLTDRYGYYVYNLRKDNQLKKVKAHKIVADAFLGERPLGMQVNHIDEDKKNNCVWNLEYVTPKENTNYGTRNIRAGRANRNNPAFSKPVRMFDINGILLAEYPSRKEAARQTGLRSGDICNAVIHNWKIGGYVWKNADSI